MAWPCIWEAGSLLVAFLKFYSLMPKLHVCNMSKHFPEIPRDFMLSLQISAIFQAPALGTLRMYRLWPPHTCNLPGLSIVPYQALPGTKFHRFQRTSDRFSTKPDRFSTKPLKVSENQRPQRPKIQQWNPTATTTSFRSESQPRNCEFVLLCTTLCHKM